MISKVQEQRLPDSKALPVVSLDEFFSGNSDYGSIGCNLPEHPGLSRFFAVLTETRERPSVQDVLVEVNEIVSDPQSWPFSDRVYVLSSATLDEVRSWLVSLQPDDVTEGWANGVPLAAPSLSTGMKVYAAWWD